MKYFILLCISFLIVSANIKDIKYDGLYSISKNVADDIIGIKKGQKLDEDKINKAIKKLFNLGYFDDIIVYNKNNILIFKFKEKPSIINVEVNGYKTRDEDLDILYTQLGIKKGTMYKKYKIKLAKEKLLHMLELEGYINSVVEVDVKKIDDDKVSIVFNVNKGDEIIIDKINYYGSNKLTKDDFETITANREHDFFWWWIGQDYGDFQVEDLKYDYLRIKDLYLQKGYLDAKVSKPFAKINFLSNIARIDYYINEGKKYKVGDIKIEVDKNILDTKKIYPNLKLYKGITFNVKKLRKDLIYLKKQIGNQGYAFADIRYNIEKKGNIANITWKIIPKNKVFINDVIISGNDRTLDRVIRRSIFLAPGDLYNEDNFIDSRKNLKRTGFFQKVEIKKEKISNNLINIIVKVKEALTGNLVVGGGYGSYDGWMLNASISDKNIFGTGKTLKFSFDHSNKTTNYTLSLINPSINDSIYSGSVDVHNKKSLITYTDYDLEVIKKGGSLGIGRRFTRNSRIGAYYSYDKVLEDYSDDTLDDNYIISSVTPYINYNSTDDFFVPREGILSGYSIEYAGLGGDANFAKHNLYYKYFYSLDDLLDKDWILRYKFNIKYLQDLGNLRAGNSFYLGGPSSLRGYQSYAFGPENEDDEAYKKFFTNSLEISFPLIPKSRMRWALFYDYGMIGQDKFDQITRSGYGAVIEWFSPVGPLQFIFSRAVNPASDDRTSNFEFNIGSRF